MTEKRNLLIWFYNDKGIVKSITLGKFLNAENQRINLCNSAQEYFPNKQDAEKNKARLYWKGKNGKHTKRNH